MGWWGESLAGKAKPDRRVVVPEPPVRARRITTRPPIRHLTLKHQISRHQARTLSQQTLQQQRGDVVRRARHHPERPRRQPEITGIGPDHRHRRVREPPTQPIGTTGMEFDGDHPGTGPNQRRGQRTESGPDVEDELARFDAGFVHDPLSPTTIERMPSPGTPRLPGAGHDGPSRST